MPVLDRIAYFQGRRDEVPIFSVEKGDQRSRKAGGEALILP